MKLCPFCRSQMIFGDSYRQRYRCLFCNETFSKPLRITRGPSIIGAIMMMAFITVILAGILYMYATKPAIYLYSPDRRKERVRIKAKGMINTTIPHVRGGMSAEWKDVELRDGKVVVDGREFDYLFYEARSVRTKAISSGWVLRRENDRLLWNGEEADQDQIIASFREILERSGLFENEIDDFIEWWFGREKRMHFGKDEFCYGIYPVPLDEAERLFKIETVHEYPEFVRVLLLVKEVPKNTVLEEPEFLEIVRNENALHEWGVLKE